jgi:hypothetical protein
VADLGDVLPFSAKLYSAPPEEGGVLVNALSAALVITLPDGTATTPTISGPVSTGVYQYDYVAAMAGRYVGRWLFTFAGGKTTAYVETFDVRPADPGYLMSLRAAKKAVNIDLADTSNDDELLEMVGAVTGLIEDYRGEVIARRTIVESFSVGRRHPYAAEWRDQSAYKLVLARTPVLSVTSIVRPLDGVTWGPADVMLTSPGTGALASLRDPFWGDLTATYTAGYQVISANVIEAAKIILRHLWQVQQTPGMGASVFGGDGGGVASPAYALPNRAAELLGGRGITLA